MVFPISNPNLWFSSLQATLRSDTILWRPRLEKQGHVVKCAIPWRKRKCVCRPSGRKDSEGIFAEEERKIRNPDGNGKSGFSLTKLGYLLFI